MLMCKLNFYRTYLVVFTCFIFLAQQSHAAAESGYSWTKKFTPRAFKTKNKQAIPTTEYTVTTNITIDVTNVEGNISIKSWEQNKIILDAMKTGTEEELAATTISVNQKDNTITIASKIKENETASTVDYTIMVPIGSSLKITNSSKGDIKIRQIRGTVNAMTEHGSIEIYDTVNSVTAKTNDGSIRIKQKNITQPNTLFLETLKGDVKLFLPKRLNADIQAKTFKGMVNSTIPVTLSPQTLVLNKETWNDMRKEVRGTLGTGGAPIIIDVSKGNIILEEY